MWNFRAPKADRIDRLLREANLPGSEYLSRNAFDLLVEEGRVLVDGKRVKKSGAQVGPGQEITVHLPQLGLLRADTPAEILWSDSSRRLALFHKPAGIASYPLLPWESDTFANRVVAYLAENAWMAPHEFAALAAPPKLEGGLLQRLDRDTSGVLAVALEKGVKENFREAFTEGKFRKTYLAIVGGAPREGAHSFEVKESGMLQAREAAGGATKIELRMRKKGPDFSLVEIKTAQGSRHVVRICLAALGSPLAGDADYGGDTGAAPFHQLHALRLELLDLKLFPSFPNDLEAPLPQSFLDCLERLGLH